MKDYALRLLIPIAGPGTRRPLTGDEPPLGALLGFCPEWYVKNAGAKFGKRWHDDCAYRYESLLTMKRELHRRFPSVADFAPRVNELGFEDGCATLSAVYGIKLIPMLYGQRMLWPDDDWPADAENAPLPVETLRALKPFDLDEHPVMRTLEAQMDEMERRFGRIEGYLNYQGVLNVALKLRGTDILIDMAEDPEFARFLLGHIAHTIDAVAHRVQARQRQSGFDIDLVSMSNCVVNMISPAMYEEFILPWDMWLAGRFQRFGVHTCNWDVTPYLGKLSQIERLGYLDMGFASDLAKAREAAPNARRAVIYSVAWLEEKPLSEIEADIARIARELAPCDIALADLMDTPDERVNAVLALIEKYSERLENGGII